MFAFFSGGNIVFIESLNEEVLECLRVFPEGIVGFLGVKA